MRRKYFLIPLIVCVAVFVAYRIHTNFIQQNSHQAGSGKKQNEKQTGLKLPPIHYNVTPAKDLIKVKGLVRERGSKKPLKGALVKLESAGVEIERLTADTQGSFEFVTDPDKLVWIIASMTGYVDAELIYFGREIKEPVLELKKCAVIKGVITHKGFAVPNVEGTLFSTPPNQILKQTKSDSKGQFEFLEIVPTITIAGTPQMDESEAFNVSKFKGPFYYSLKIENPDYCELWIKDIRVKEDDVLFYRIELTRCGIIEGGIYDEIFKLLDGVTVSVKAMDCNHFKEGLSVKPESPNNYTYTRSVVKSKTGKFSLELPEGYYHIIGDPTGNFTVYQSNCIRLVTGQRITHDIYLKTGKIISGIVIDEALKLLGNVDVIIISEEGQLIPRAWIGSSMDIKSYKTKEDGCFSFSGLSDGFYRIAARHHADEYEEVEVENVTAGTNDLRIILKKKQESKKADVEVRLSAMTGNLSASRYLDVTFINEDRDAEGKAAGGMPKEDRIFMKENYLPEGTYTIVGMDRKLNLYGVIPGQYITKLQKNLISLVLDRKGAVLKGKVLNYHQGFFTLRLLIDRQKKLGFFEFIHPDDEGNFELSGLPPGYVTIDFGGWPRKKMEFELQPYEVKDLGIIDLKE